MKNIWILNHYAGPPNFTPLTKAYDLANQLVKKGYSVTIFFSSFSHYRFKEVKFDSSEKSFYKKEDYQGVKMVWIRTWPYQRNNINRVLNMFSFFFMAFLVGLGIKERPDVIIGSSPHLFTPLSAYLLAKFKRSKFCLEIRDFWPQTMVDMGVFKEKSLVTKLLRKLERFLYKKSDKIITVLPYAGKYLEKFSIPEEKVFFSPNGVDSSRYEGISDYDGGKKNMLTIMYIGGFLHAHRLDILLEAAQRLQEKRIINLKFVLVGDGPARNSLIHLAKDMKLNNIHFPGFIPKSEITEIMNQADVFFGSLRNLPQLHKYGISVNKLFTYLSAARPVVFAANIPANNPIAESGAGITVGMENVDALVNAFLSLISLPAAKRKEIGEKGKAYVKKYYDIKILAEEFEKNILLGEENNLVSQDPAQAEKLILIENCLSEKE